MLESVMSVAPGSKTVDSHDETGTKTGPKNVLPGTKCRISKLRKRKTLIKSMVGVTGFEPPTPTSRRLWVEVPKGAPLPEVLLRIFRLFRNIRLHRRVSCSSLIAPT